MSQTIDQARSLISEIRQGGNGSPYSLCELLNLVLAPVVSGNNKLQCKPIKNVTLNQLNWVIQPVDGIKPLKLNGGHFLLIQYMLDLDEHESLSVIKSKIQYQLKDGIDETREVFRYDYERPSEHPKRSGPLGLCPASSHLQVYARLDQQESVHLSKTTLSHQHFPCGKVSLETIVKFLINDFGILLGDGYKLEDMLPVLEIGQGAFDLGYGKRSLVEKYTSLIRSVLHTQ